MILRDGLGPASTANDHRLPPLDDFTERPSDLVDLSNGMGIPEC
jgi:hypothetical protein